MAHLRRAGSSSGAGTSGSGSRAVLDAPEPIVRRRVTPTPTQQHEHQQDQTERSRGKQPMGSYSLKLGSAEGWGDDTQDDDGGKGLQKPARPRGPGEGTYNPAAAGTSASINSFMNDFDAYAKKTQDRLEAWFGIAGPSTSTSSRAHPSNAAESSKGASSQAALSRAPHTQKPPRPSRESDDQDSDTSLVYIHHVQPSDTVASLSLQYGIEPSILRRVNKLWAGDQPQMRGQIYIPVNACKAPQSSSGSAKGKGAGSSASPSSSAEDDLHSDYLQSREGGRKSSMNGVAYGFWIEERGLVRKGDARETGSTNFGGIAVEPPTPLQEGHLRMHDRAISTSSGASAGVGTRSAASVSARSRASSGAGSRMTTTSLIPGSVQRVPKQELRFFSPGTSAAGGVNVSSGSSHFQHDHSSSGSSTASWAGKTGYGQSGLDDLLQISHERALAAANGGKAKGKASAIEDDEPRLRLPGRTSNQGDREEVLGSDTGTGGEGAEDGRSDAGTSYSDRLGGDDNWKPNKWTLGQRKKSMASLSRTNSDQGSQATIANHVASVSGLRPLQLVQSNFPNAPSDASLERASQGWNDVPPSGANVSHAYSSKRLGENSKAHHRLLNDLTAGLPPNPGPASSWQRPIGASLPPPPPGAARTGTIAPNEARASASAGFGKLFNDAFRGRISVEGAFEAVMDQVTGKAAPEGEASASSARRRTNASMPTLPPNRPDLRGNDTGSLGRVSAEEARASLSMGRASKHDPGDGGQQANGVPMDHISLSISTAQGATGPRRVRSRAGLRDVEWHKE